MDSTRTDDYVCVFHLTTIDDYSDAKEILYYTNKTDDVRV